MQDLVLATHEALANAVDHAYPHHPGRIWVTTQCTESHVLVIAVTTAAGAHPLQPDAVAACH